MVESDKLDEIRFRGFETLGDIRASAAETRKAWHRLAFGLLAAGVIVAAMLPMSLKQEANALQPGPIEDRMIYGLEWWHSQMQNGNIDFPAIQMRQFAEDISAKDWQTVYCVLSGYGLPEENIRSITDLFTSGEQVYECE